MPDQEEHLHPRRPSNLTQNENEEETKAGLAPLVPSRVCSPAMPRRSTTPKLLLLLSVDEDDHAQVTTTWACPTRRRISPTHKRLLLPCRRPTSTSPVDLRSGADLFIRMRRIPRMPPPASCWYVVACMCKERQSSGAAAVPRRQRCARR